MRLQSLRTTTWLLLFVLFTTTISAQIPCIDFEDFPVDTEYKAENYPAGSTLFTKHDVPVTIDSFYYEDGDAGMWGASVNTLNPNFAPDIIGNAFWISNTTVIYDFTSLDYDVKELTFHFWDGGGITNFSVNGEDIKISDKLTELPKDIAPGVDFFLEFIEETDQYYGSWGQITLSGNIETLRIGGQEFFMDNVCFSPEASMDCKISNVKATPEDCTPNNIFYVNLDFDALHPASDSFIVKGNGMTHGTLVMQMFR